MAGVKFTSYVDEIAKRETAERVADQKAMLEVIEHDIDAAIDDLRGAIGIMLNRVETGEAVIGQLEKRIEKLERKGEPKVSA